MFGLFGKKKTITEAMLTEKLPTLDDVKIAFIDGKEKKKKEITEAVNYYYLVTLIELKERAEKQWEVIILNSILSYHYRITKGCPYHDKEIYQVLADKLKNDGFVVKEFTTLPDGAGEKHWSISGWATEGESSNV